MTVSAGVAFACAVLAAIGTGVLIGRCIRLPRPDLAAWVLALAGITVSAGAQALGDYHGYGPPAFRAVQLGAQLAAPLGLAWGLSQLAARSVIVRFAGTLVSAALAVVAGVVLVTDPLGSTGFGKNWPPASAHYQIIAKTLLDVIAVVTVAVVVLALLPALVRARADRGWRHALGAIAAASVAAVAILCLRLKLPDNSAYPAVCAASALLAWFAGVRAGKVPLAELHAESAPPETGRRRRREPAAAKDHARDEVTGAGHRRNGERGAAPARFGDEAWQQHGGAEKLAGDAQPNGGYPANGGYRRDGGYEMRGLRRGTDDDDAERFGLAGHAQPEERPADDGVSSAAFGLAGQTAGRGAGGPADQGAARRLYGLIAIYTLAEGRAAEFDALAERVVDEVRSSEPDALVYAVHSVANAAMQRIFYEVYRDRMAYEDHKRQPHIQRFEAERVPYVLATNVIELSTQQAKLSSLPGLTQTFGRQAGG